MTDVLFEQNFLLLEELVPSASLVRPSNLPPAAEAKVTMLNASTTWKEVGTDLLSSEEVIK